MEHTLPQRNNAIVAFMGGPSFLKQVIIGREEEILATGPEDLEFHTNWNWIMPVWKKLRIELVDWNEYALVLSLNTALGKADIKRFHDLASHYCLEWCTKKQIKL